MSSSFFNVKRQWWNSSVFPPADKAPPPNASLVFAKNTGLGAMVPITKNTQALVGIRSNEAKEEE